MRLHHLEVTAFGPFAETVRVDFTELADAGLFLLTGPTGAGKTSVLDAVCFGLYGEVPGDRGSARALRSDHADPDVEPRVVLELAVGARVLRLSRTPAWDRPKRRGHGTRRVQASVVVEERDGELWAPVTTRLDEAGQLVGDLLGMTCRQFTQVALLPQGRFQAFLRASSSERHAVLQRLFRTQRFDDVERWLADQRVARGREVAAAHGRCVSVLHRLLEAADAPLPESWEADTPEGLGRLHDSGELATWSADLARQLREQVAKDAEALAAEAAAVADAEEQHQDDVRRWQARLRGEQAERRLADLDGRAVDLARDAARMAAHDAALPVLPAARRLGAAAEDLAARRADLARHRRLLLEDGSAGPTGHEETRRALESADPVGSLDRLHAETERAHAVATSWLPREQELVHVRQEHRHAAAARDRLRDEVESVAARRAALQDQHAAALARRDALVPLAAAGPDLESAWELARGALDAAREAVDVTASLTEARRREDELAARFLDLRERWLDLRERRLEGMAGELATGLAAGCSCPVCGSTDHPVPALVSGSVTAADEDAAREEMETAGVHRQAAAEVRTGLLARLAALEEVTQGHGTSHWQGEAETLGARTQAARQAGRDLGAVEEQITSLERTDRALELALTDATAGVRSSERTLEALDRRIGPLESELAALLQPDGGATPASVADRVRSLEARRDLLAAARAGARAVADAERAREQAAAAAREQVAQAGFDSLEACLAAQLDDAERRRLEETAELARIHRSQAEAALAEPDVAAALASVVTDPARSQEVLEQRRRQRDLRLTAARASSERAARASALRDQLDDLLAAWQPCREAHALAARVAALVEGTSADNRLRMRLSGYVLSERLRQVVAAANHRLGAMTDQRFALEHVEEKGAGEQRGGLSLRMRDDWSGTTRDPATLSGGESFVVSLALALGLADTVAHEAGGTEVETLFVDEGFGSLDAETLDAVMDVLDGLRDGGRVVGLVSHVAELRARIAAQLHVAKTPRGSTVRTARAGG